MVNLEKFLFGLLGTRNFPVKTDSDKLLKLWKKFQNLETKEVQSVSDLVHDIIKERSKTRYDAETLVLRSRHILKPYLLPTPLLLFPEMDYDDEERKFWSSSENDVAPYTIPDYMQGITEYIEPLTDDKNTMSQSNTNKPANGRVSKIKTSDWF